MRHKTTATTTERTRGSASFHYYAESLGGGRAIMRVDVVVDGVLVPELCGTVGSPAPIETVRAHERTVTL